MLPVRCIRCHRPHTGARRRRDPRCRICRGRLEVDVGASALCALPDSSAGEVVAPIARAEPGSYPAGPRTYASLIEFVNAAPRRGPSREHDLGLRWRCGDRVLRAAWIVDTCELYLVQSGDPAAGGGHVELVASAHDMAMLEEALGDWRTRCGEPGSADWLRERARAATSLPRPVERTLTAQVLAGGVRGYTSAP